MGAAHVQQRGEREFAGQFELGLEQCLLARAVQLGQEPVEAEFAEGAQFGLSGEALQPVA
jgi:hypothetical protein